MNTRLAEIYKPRDELSVELPALMRECRDDYSLYDLPVEVDFLCAGIDTHDNCLFVEVVGFSKDGREHWGVEYFVAPYDLQVQEESAIALRCFPQRLMRVLTASN